MAHAIVSALALGYNLPASAPQLRPAVRCTTPACSMMQPQMPRAAASAAAAAALAATIAASPALAADPWPYSTLISKVQADDVAKVPRTTAQAPPPAPPLWDSTVRDPPGILVQLGY